MQTIASVKFCPQLVTFPATCIVMIFHVCDYMTLFLLKPFILFIIVLKIDIICFIQRSSSYYVSVIKQKPGRLYSVPV